MRKLGPPRFEDLTETTGVSLSPEGAQMMYTRYWAAAGLARDKRVLELGCGSGQGLGLVGREARQVIGGDVSLALLRSGQRHYQGRFPFVQLAAARLPFRGAVFDLVLCFEASYYVPDMNAAFRELARVLRPRGTVLFVNANPERPDFIRSPHSVHYHTADEFRGMLDALGFDVVVEGAFRSEVSRNGGPSLADKLISLARRFVTSLGLVPTTLRGRARLKRLVYGRLVEVPPELPVDFADVAQRTEVPHGPIGGFKVLYVAATLRS